MNKTETIRQAVGRSGLTGSKIEKMKIMSAPSYSRKIKNPQSFTLGELIKLDKVVHVTEEEIKNSFGRR